jgi:hypothetical protein
MAGAMTDSKIAKPVILYNPTSKPVFIRDLDIKIKAGETLDVLGYSKRISEAALLASAERGSMREALLSGSVIFVDSAAPRPTATKFTESRKPISRHQLLAPIAKSASSNFIERLQQDFSSRILAAPEQEIAKNTEQLINSVDFEGFDDPLE